MMHLPPTLARLAAVAALGFSMAAHGQAAPAATVRLLELADRPVMDARGTKVAEVYDVVVDTTEGRAAYLVVSVGLKVVPLPMPSAEVSIGPDRVVVEKSRAELERMPALDMSALGPNYKRGRDILGADLKDQQGADIGDVKDLVLNAADGVIASVVIAFDPKAWEQPGWVALPRASVRHEGRDFVATFNLDDMRPASQAQAEQRRIDAANAAAKAAAAAAANLDRDERASQVLGRKIVDAQGGPVGEIADLVMDGAGTRLLHAVVKTASGATAALALPVKDMTRSGEAFALPPGAPGLAPAPAQAGGKRVTEVIGRKLVDYRGKEVGGVRDVIVNLAAGKVRYAVGQFDTSWVAAGHVVTIRMPREDAKVELNALMGAMIFQDAAWPDINHPQFISAVDAYLAKQ